MPICRRCGENKPDIRFAMVLAYNSRRKTCRDCYCKVNRKRYESNKDGFRTRSRKAQTKWTRRNGHTYDIQRRYGLSKEQYKALLQRQKGCCALCEKPPKQGARNGKLSVDHNHRNNKVRGLLCVLCNIMLGRFKDDTKKFQKVIRYLQKGNENPNS